MGTPASAVTEYLLDIEPDVAALFEADGLCVCCLLNEAIFVMSNCGHCVFCRGCRRKMVHKVHSDVGDSMKSMNRHDLQNRELTRTKVACPLCRCEGLIVEKSSYDGAVLLP